MSSRVAVVTGGSRGIGRAISLSLAGGGHRVVVNYRSRAEEAKDTVADIESIGAEAIAVQADVSDHDQVDRLFDHAEGAFGRVTVLVNNAGIRRDSLALRMSDSDWDEVLATNLFGAFSCSRRALKGMLRERWGRIVNVASIAGIRGVPGQANYCAAKAGLIGLTKALAVEVASRNIAVNAVAPGLITSDLTTSLDDARFASLEATIPMGRAGTPEDVAHLVEFLCSESATYISGAVFTTDGAMTA